MPSSVPFAVTFIRTLLGFAEQDLCSFKPSVAATNSFTACTSSAAFAIINFLPSYCIMAKG